MYYTYSPTDSSRSPSSPDSPTSSPTHYVWPAPSRQRRRTTASPYTHYNNNHSHTTSSTTTTTASSVKSRRFYSTPLCEDSPDPKTPLQAYGLEQREPSIYESKTAPKILHRMSNVLDDIKEDLSLDSRGGAEKQRLRRRESAFFDGPPVAAGSASPPLPPVSAIAPVDGGSASVPSSPVVAPAPGVASRRRSEAVERTRPLSVLSWENTWSLSRRFSRRLSMLGSSFTSRRKRMGTSISQPNLIGSSTPM